MIADTTQLDVLLASDFERQGEFGRAQAQWASHVLAGTSEAAVDFALDEGRIGRSRLHQMRDEGASPERLFLSIMAWGGLTLAHGRAAWPMRDFWSAVIRRAMEGGLTRQALFEAFNARPIPGMRAAYFTKLIHFCQQRGPEPLGYIMDQWTAKSINLIWGKPVVKMAAVHWVHPDNDATAYESFCRKIDALAPILGLSGSETEERLFSRGGRTPLPWRAHVRRMYRAS